MFLINTISDCLQNYREKNAGKLPDRIFMFRDGVGEGQIKFTLETEVAQMKEGVREAYASAGQGVPKITFVIVTKKINTRAFFEGNKNLPVGTVIDKAVTLPERYVDKLTFLKEQSN